MTSQVHLLVAGGTIAMTGSPARPSVEAVEELSRAVGGGVTVTTEVFAVLPSVHFSPAKALGLCRRAVELARGGTPVVVTHGTDLLEEVALLCDLLSDAEAPIVFTGAMRTASAPGADGPANLAAALAVAASDDARGLGVLVAFAGKVHAARFVRKADSTSVDAFASPQAGPLGVVEEGRFTAWWRPPRLAPLDVSGLDATVEVLTPGLGSSPDVVRAVADACDGLVVSVPGAGHTPPDVLQVLQEVATAKPVVAVPRPWRGALLHATYGFAGSEADLRSGAIACAGTLAAPAARIALLACLGAGFDLPAIRAFFARYD